MEDQIIRDKLSFGIMTKTDFNKFPKIVCHQDHNFSTILAV
jgi:hypothetical protein